MALRIASRLLEQMKKHASLSYPDECCGFLLGGEEGEVQEVIESRNMFEGPRERRYFISPEQMRDAEKHASERSLFVTGIYHSHPDAPAEPSSFDLENAWPWFRYLILSARASGVVDVSGWLLRDDRSGFNREEITML